jgi:CRISPR-associated protein Cas1
LPEQPKNGKLRVKQYTKYSDAKSRYHIAEQIVHTKIANTLQLLQQLSSFYDCINLHEINSIVRNDSYNKEGKYHASSANCNNKISMENNENTKSKTVKEKINILMNYEGRIATVYWNNIANIVNKLYPEFHFQSRKNKSYSWNMNASDEVNALLNYGYAILESEVRRDINAVGLDPSVGFLHEVAASKTPLVYDLQELFRWLVDYSVLQLLEEKKLKKSDFIVTENYHMRLKCATAKMLIERISLNYNKTTRYKGKNHAYQTILMDNVQLLANFITGKQKTLIFHIPELRMGRSDTLELQQRIMSMSPNERRRLGITKSTLWYQKKRLAEGKTIKLYDKVSSRLA